MKINEIGEGNTSKKEKLILVDIRDIIYCVRKQGGDNVYDYVKSKEIVEAILKSPTKIVEKNLIPASDSEFTYENGIKAWVGALFVDIVDSRKLFQSANENTARIIRSFCSEIISILKDDANYREIGIRGDCVYCIYTVAYKQDLVEIFRHAYRINSFMKMLNKLLTKHGYSSIRAGIGLGCGEDLIVKAGQNGSGINDKIWIGKAVVDAAHLSDIANRNGTSAITMSPLFHDNVVDLLCEENTKYKTWVKPHLAGYYGSIDYYHCDIVETDFDKWIEENL